MIVAKRMTTNPIIVSSATTVVDAMHLMRTNNIRRLPVVDNGKLVGIVTDRDLRQASASPATTLSVHELNYLLAKLQIKDIMKKKLWTILPEDTIEEAALVMYEKKVGGLIVTDNDGKVVGIITDSDVFKAFVNVMGISKRDTTRLTLEVPDKVGVVCDISGVFKEIGISIDSFVSYMLDNGKYELIIRAVIPDVDEVVTRLKEKGYPVSHMVKIG